VVDRDDLEGCGLLGHTFGRVDEAGEVVVDRKYAVGIGHVAAHIGKHRQLPVIVIVTREREGE
jgi:hypothetical protein